MEREQDRVPVPAAHVESCATTALTLVHSAPTPGVGSRYADTSVAHESRLLAAAPLGEELAGAGERGVGQTVLESALASGRLSGLAEARTAAYLAPHARAALLGQPLGQVLKGLGPDETATFAQAFEAAGEGGPLAGALRAAPGAGGEATLREVMRFAASRDALAREYARSFEVTRQLAHPALTSSLSRGGSARAALVHAYLEVLSEVPDLDTVARAGRQEAEEVSRMARGVLKSGGVHSRRGLQAATNLDGILRADSRLSPTATEPIIVVAAFLLTLEHGPGALGSRLGPATGSNGR